VHQVFERGEDLEALLLASSAEARLLARDRQVARDRQRREDAAVVGHPADARAAISWVAARVMSRRRSECARRAGVSPRIERSVVVLPAPFGRAARRPRPRRRERTPNSACVSP
jgi:hypothetical protein